MNLVIWMLVNKRTGKSSTGGYFFTDQARDNKTPKKIAKMEGDNFIEHLGYDPKHYRINMLHYTTLKKLRKAFYQYWFFKVKGILGFYK